jgi:hypothetical protein
VSDVEKIFGNACASQPGGVHDGEQFKRCSLYTQLKSREILQKLVVTIQSMRCTPFLISDATYPIRTYLQKNWKTHNPTNVDKIRYDYNMNSRKVVIENAFGSLKNKWRILKHFNSRVDKTSPITIACCVLHNYCEMWGALKLKLANAKIRGDNLMGFGVNRLPIVKE